MNRPLVVLTTKRGKILNAFEGDSITREIQVKGEYDGNALDSLSDVLAMIQPEVSLDIGANIGNHTLVIADYSKHVIAFEPVDFIFQVLKTNIEQNRSTHVEFADAGLSDKTGEAEIFIPDNANLGSSSLEVAEGKGEKLKIRTLIGDQYLSQHHVGKIDFIKMDVEGHEVPALKGLKKTIEAYQPLLLLEYKIQKTIDGFREKNLFNTLFAGYTVFSLTVTSSKKIHGGGVLGLLKRSYYKHVAKHWVLSSFAPAKRYSNIYLVPSRYLPCFASLPFMKAFSE
jgi:FkbM family methyltransferase